MAARCRLVAADFFDHLPDRADACVLKSVLNDWDDERSLTILKNCRAALGGRGTLLVIDRVLPEGARPDTGASLMDLQMMVVTGGRLRTAEEHRALLAAAGFRMTNVIPTRSGRHIIEAVPAEGPQNPA